MQEKEKIELYLASLFIERQYNQKVFDNELLPGNPEKQEPDIFYKNIGIEIGAVLKGSNTHLDNYENEFLKQANKAIKGKIQNNIKINLVLQDDKETVSHQPNSEFEKYKYLPLFLDGIFVEKYFDNSQIKHTLDLNQINLMRVNTIPNIKNIKIFSGFINDLIKYINNINDCDFVKMPTDCNYVLHHKEVCDGRFIKNDENPLSNFISKKIIEKLKKDKYKGNHSTQILLLHNFNTLAFKEPLTTDLHFYSHYREFIFNKIAELIKSFNSFNIYDEIFFMDFSNFLANMNFELIDFKTVEIKKLDYNVLNDGHIRCKVTVSHGMTDTV